MNKIKIVLILFSLYIIATLIYYYIKIFTNIIGHHSDGTLRDLRNYRLGDVIEFDMLRNDKWMPFVYATLFRGSIAHEYINRTSKSHDYQTLYEIVKERRRNVKDLAPKNTLIIHIRIGDAIDWEYPDPIDDILSGKKPNRYSVSYDYLDQKIKMIEHIKDVIIVGGYHTGGDHSRSEEYISKIEKHLKNKNLNVKTMIKSHGSSNADQDLIWMSNSEYFVKSNGRFSNLVNRMVEMNGGKILEPTIIMS